MIETGEQAPDFTLPDQNGEPVRLADHRGSWVVRYFYPKDDTPGCTTEACEFTAGIESFRNLDAVVVGVSPDPPESHRKFIAKYDLDLELLSDPDHEVMETYGAWGEKVLYGKKTTGVIRSTAIVDPDGRIAHHWKRVNAAGHAEQVRARLEQLQSS
jgi:peroxiredoxin Q/BCP